MTKLEKIHDDVCNDGIVVNDYHFSDIHKAACMMTDDYKTIALDRAAIETSAEELTLLGEEHAHYETGALYMVEATYNTPIARTNRIVAEGQALRHAIKKLTPFDEMSEVFSRFVDADGLDIYGLAEYFEVMPEFMKQAIKHYHQQGMRW